MIIKLTIISQGGFVSPSMLLLAMMILLITKNALFPLWRAAISLGIITTLIDSSNLGLCIKPVSIPGKLNKVKELIRAEKGASFLLVLNLLLIF